MTDHRCDAHAHVTEGIDLVGLRPDELLPIVQCELFLGHEGDHRVVLAWPDPVAAAEDATWSAERNDPDEMFDVEVPINPPACGVRWDKGLGEPYTCSLARGHEGEHLLNTELIAKVHTSEDIDRVRRERLGENPWIDYTDMMQRCGSYECGDGERCIGAVGHSGAHADNRGHSWL